jgi:flavin-dependent dehydrogenase
LNRACGRFDVAVVGGGPAGSAAAIVLAGSGARVVLLERSAYDGVRIGETLPPDVRLPLERLGAWDRFLDGGHTPSPGIVAAWGRREPYANDFILNPYGCGWRVDRNAFDSMLATGAGETGAIVMTAVTVRCLARARRGGWTVEFTRHGKRWTLSTNFVVDATGRTSPFCRFLGARREVRDRLVALVGLATAAGTPALDHRAFIEATEEGWWYSADLPDGRLVFAFHTDPVPRPRAQWARYLAAAPATAARAGETVGQEIRVVCANTHRLRPIAGEGWLAVGDAATAHDPLTGLGIHWALESGIAGAEAVAGSKATEYCRDQEERFDRYLAARAFYYRAEARWPHSEFWQRRHQIARGRDA